jgi:hypothetical protein
MISAYVPSRSFRVKKILNDKDIKLFYDQYLARNMWWHQFQCFVGDATSARLELCPLVYSWCGNLYVVAFVHTSVKHVA